MSKSAKTFMPEPTEAIKESLFSKLGGRSTLERVHKIFYDKIYAHPWIGQFFQSINQTHIENQQTDFMTAAMGGGEVYSGAFPIPGHKHMYVTEELFELRHGMLVDSLKEAGVPDALAEKWLKIDGAFRTGIVKKTRLDCKPRYASEGILDYTDPEKKKAA